MKHVLTLLVAVVLAAGTAARAEAAVQLGATGNLDAVAVLTDAYAEKNEKEDTLDLRSRLRATFSAEANQYIKGYWEFQVGEWCWGHPNGTDNPGPMDTNIQDFKTRLSWIEAKFPNTPLSMSAGLIQLTLPNAVGGNPLYDARTAGAALSADLGGGITLTGFYGRPAQNNGAATSNPNTNSADMFGLIVSVEKGTLKAEPYFTYAKVGHSSGVPLPWADGLSNDGKYTALTGAGLALTADFKPVVLKLDAIYARADNKTENAFDTKGYHIALAADYKAKFGTPGLIAWYSSGADKEGKGVLPVLGVDGGVVYTRMFTYGTASLGDEGFGSGTAVGSMGLGLQIKEVSFIKSLTHTFRLAYIKGTNDDECPWPMDDLQYDGLEKGVAFIEVGFDSSYAVTDNFTAALELGYLKPRVRSELADGTIPKVIAGVPPAPGNIDAYNTNPIYNANIYLLYAF